MSQEAQTSQKAARISDIVRLALVAAAPVVAQLIGSAFNIWYNLTQVWPLLSETQHARLIETISVFNMSIYPAATVIWWSVVFRLLRSMRSMLAGEELDAHTRWRARQRVINLPWWIAGVGGTAWLSCIPALIISLRGCEEIISMAASDTTCRVRGTHHPRQVVVRFTHPTIFSQPLR